MKIRLAILPFLGLLAFSLPAQDQNGQQAPPGEPPPDVTGAPDEGVLVTADGASKVQPGLGMQAWCAMLAMMRPARLAPGEGGEIAIVLALQDKAVMQPGAPMKVIYESQQGPVALAAHRLEPAKPGKLYPAFKNQAIYDNTATVHIPIQIDPKAKFGKYPVQFTLELTFTDGHTGKSLGTYREGLQGEVLVGRPLPRPVPLSAPAKRRPKSAASSSEKAALTSQKENGAAMRRQPSPLEAAGTGARGSERSEPEVAGEAGEAPAEGSDNLLIYAAGGVLLLLVLALFLRR